LEEVMAVGMVEEAGMAEAMEEAGGEEGEVSA
jgi:hypothetical protein